MIPDDEEGWVERAATIAGGGNSLETRDLAIDLAGALEELPSALRALCEQLKTQTVSEASRATGIPRWRLYASIEELRRLFAEAGTQDYL